MAVLLALRRQHGTFPPLRHVSAPRLGWCARCLLLRQQQKTRSCDANKCARLVSGAYHACLLSMLSAVHQLMFSTISMYNLVRDLGMRHGAGVVAVDSTVQQAPRTPKSSEQCLALLKTMACSIIDGATPTSAPTTQHVECMRCLVRAGQALEALTTVADRAFFCFSQAATVCPTSDQCLPPPPPPLLTHTLHTALSPQWRTRRPCQVPLWI